MFAPSIVRQRRNIAKDFNVTVRWCDPTTWMKYTAQSLCHSWDWYADQFDWTLIGMDRTSSNWKSRLDRRIFKWSRHVKVIRKCLRSSSHMLINQPYGRSHVALTMWRWHHVFGATQCTIERIQCTLQSGTQDGGLLAPWHWANERNQASMALSTRWK
jgi:hypothetical protein